MRHFIKRFGEIQQDGVPLFTTIQRFGVFIAGGNELRFGGSIFAKTMLWVVQDIVSIEVFTINNLFLFTQCCVIQVAGSKDISSIHQSIFNHDIPTERVMIMSYKAIVRLNLEYILKSWNPNSKREVNRGTKSDATKSSFDA